ncbi:rRNA maturation RNase YbeY [Anaerobacillus alkalidiazotrophicus]|uniref:Endoribonuclease YbeY n=1 Tax=Anaerobacillus alkalidiazotrophicus TaxID=472963 RepID=A0A1S2MC36_9BACI|nr:rRNA maturation RNase YbeY [Anaerobacillus alkalidiazotrophicus]OIJ22134.1 rRNA maturation RNase YbeY [Anaerobacillus alkalidiazotrophicus]
MIIEVEIQDETNQLTEEQLLLVNNLLNYAAKLESVQKGSELSVTFVDNEAIRVINREYRNKDTATDVISFALNDDESDINLQENIPNLLGDIIVSYEKTVSQAEEYGHSINRELGFLVVHGFLHLLGYDHMNETEEKIMFTRQEEILEAYGLQK